MEQYPDSIVVTVVTAATKDEESGLYTEGSTTPYTFSCRAEVNGTGRQIPGKDGSLIVYAYTVYMPGTETILPPDSGYTLTSDRFGTVTGKLLRASNGQLNSRIWL